MFAKVLNLVILFTIITVKAPSVWGFSVSRTDDYIAQAEKLNLSQQIKWLRLGHYKKTFAGYESDFRGQIFLHPDGHLSPEKELTETLHAFFTDNYQSRNKFDREPQCQFLARRNWLTKNLNIASEDLLPCTERVEWKKRLGATSASLIFAAADLSNPASSFGG